MIGVAGKTGIFEFRSTEELAQALTWYKDKYDSRCTVLVLAKMDDKVKGVIYNDTFTFVPDLEECTTYQLIGTTDESFKDLRKNVELPYKTQYELKKTFAYCTQRVPKELEIYNN